MQESSAASHTRTSDSRVHSVSADVETVVARAEVENSAKQMFLSCIVMGLRVLSWEDWPGIWASRMGIERIS